MAKVLRTVIQLRRATTAEWEQYKHVVPAAGEPCYDTELNTLKIGNGSSTYEQLAPIGGNGTIAVAADGNSIVLENDTFYLAGFDIAATGAQPRKNAEGKLEWYVPSVSIDGLAESIESLQAKVSAIETSITGTGDGSIDAKIDEKINQFAEKVSDDGVVNSYKELIDYVATHGGEAAAMAEKIAALQELVGNESVANQISAAIAGSGSGGGGTIDTIKLGENALDIINRTVTIPIGAGLSGSEEIVIGENGALSISSIDMSKIITNESTEVVLDGGSANR